jgi:hypothetical protein
MRGEQRRSRHEIEGERRRGVRRVRPPCSHGCPWLPKSELTKKQPRGEASSMEDDRVYLRIFVVGIERPDVGNVSHCDLSRCGENSLLRRTSSRLSSG